MPHHALELVRSTAGRHAKIGRFRDQLIAAPRRPDVGVGGSNHEEFIE